MIISCVIQSAVFPASFHSVGALGESPLALPLVEKGGGVLGFSESSSFRSVTEGCVSMFISGKSIRLASSPPGIHKQMLFLCATDSAPLYPTMSKKSSLCCPMSFSHSFDE
eukprot:30736-Pelagococcus_subviridis.AAC.4